MPFQNFDISRPQETAAFQSPQELRDLLLRELRTLGWQGYEQNVQVNPAQIYKQSGWESVPNEFEVKIAHPQAEGQAWFGRVRGAPNETLMIRTGEGYNFMRGDLRSAGVAGIGEGVSETPFYTGIQSFARRVSGAFGSWVEQKGQTPERFTMRDTVMDFFRRINTQAHPWGGSFQTPEGQNIPGRIPASNLYVSPTEVANPQAIRHQAGTYNVPIVEPGLVAGETPEQQRARYSRTLEQSVGALQEQANLRGLSPSSIWSRLFGGYVHEPSTTTGAVYVTPWASGELTQRGGETAVDVFTPKPYKQTYVAGRREMATPMMLYEQEGQQRLSMIPQEFLRQASITLRSGEQPYQGIPMRTVTSIGELPWGSGAMQAQLPPGLREYITEQGGMLMAGRFAREQQEVKAKNLQTFAESKFQMDPSVLGKRLDPGKRVVYTTGVPEGQRLSYTAGNQYEQIYGYQAVLPEAWREGLTQEQLEPWLKRLTQKGFQQISFGAGEDPIVELMKVVATTGAFKGQSAKGQMNPSLVGVEQAVQTATGMREYDILQNARNIEALMLPALQGMERPHEFLGTLFRGDKDVLQALTTMRRGNIPLSLEDVGKLSGRAQTGTEMLMQVTNALRAYPNQEELIQKFGAGIIEKGRQPIEQYDPETYRLAKEGLVEHLKSQGMGQGDIKQYLRTFNKNVTFDRDTNLYTSWMTTQSLYSTQLKTIVQEAAGVGSTQGEHLQAMLAQGQGGVARWMQEREANLFPDNPARVALQDVTRAWQATQWGHPQELRRFATIDKDIARTIREGVLGEVQRLETAGEPYGQTQLMSIYENVMREATGRQEGPEPIYWDPLNKVAMAGGGQYRELESLLSEITEEGGMEFQTQAQVATKFNRFMGGLLESAELEIPDELLRRNIQSFQGEYTDTDQLRKQRGGIFSRAAGTSTVPPGQVVMTPEGLRRNYLLQGGTRNPLEWRRYQRIMEGATGIMTRYPAPNIGTEGMPGSIHPVSITTEQPWVTDPKERMKRTGPRIIDAMKRSGLMLPDLITSSIYGANLGDIDLDPYTLLPLAIRTGKGVSGGWKRFYGETGDNEEYSGWLRQITENLRPAQQQKTFNALFGAQAASMNPWGQNMQASIARMMGPSGERLLQQQIGGEIEDIREGLFAKRAQLGTQEFQAEGMLWNETKTKGMGSAYNIFRRRPAVAASFLGVPERLATEMVDIGQARYQSRLDFENKFQNFFENIMGTSGFQAELQDTGAYEARWGVNMAGGSQFSYSTQMWNPMEEDVSALVRRIGAGIGTSEMPADWVSSMLMQVPEGAGEDVLRERRTQISEAITGARAVQGTPAARSTAMARAMTGLEEQGLIGTRSVAGMSALAAGFERTAKDPTKRAGVMAGFARRGGILMGGERVPYEQLEQELRPLSTLFDFSRHLKGEQRYKTVEGVGEVLLSAEQRGIGNLPMVRDYRKTWGGLAGFSEEGPLRVAHPVTGEPMPIQTREDLTALVGASQQVQEQFETPYARVLEMMDPIRQFKTGEIARKQAAGQKLDPRDIGILTASELSYPEGYTGTGAQEPRIEGTRAHQALAYYLQQAQPQGVSDVERRVTKEGLVTGQTDFIYTDPETGERSIMDLKTGTTRPEEYAGQMGIYRLTHKAQGAKILPVHRDVTERFFSEEFGAIRADPTKFGGAERRKALFNVGEKIFQQGMGNLVTLGPEQTSPQVVEQFMSRYMKAQGIPIPGMAGGAPRQGQPIPQPGAPGGPGGPTGGTPVAEAMQEPEEEPQRQTFSQVGRQMAGQADMAEIAQYFANTFLKQVGSGGGRGTIFGRRTKYSPVQAQAVWQTTEAMFGKYFGEFTEGGELQGGTLRETFQELPQMLSQMFTGEQREAIAGMAPQEAIAQAPMRAQQLGINFRRGVQSIPRLQGALQQFGWFQKFAQAITPQMRDLGDTGLPGMAVQAMAAGGSEAARYQEELNIPGGAQLGTRLGETFTGFQSLQQIVSATKAGRAGEQPLTTQGVDLANRWLGLMEQTTKAMDMQVKSLGDLKGRHTEFNEAIERGLELDPNRMLAKLETLGKTEAQLMGRAIGVRKMFGLPTEGAAGLITPGEFESIRGMGIGKEEQATALERYETSQQAYARARVGAMATGMGRPTPAGWGGGGDELRGYGRLARATMGGFGLMYLRSIWDITTGGAQMGYAPFQEQQAMISQTVGQAMGGGMPYWGPEQQLQQAQTMYGGAGFAGFRAAQAQIAQRPGLQGGVNLLQAALAGGGAGLWMGGMIPIPGAAVALGAAGAIAAPVGMTAMSMLGGMAQPEITGVGMASRLFTGGFTPEELQATMDQRSRVNPLTGGRWTLPGSSWAAGIVGPLSNFFASPTDTQRAAWRSTPEAQDITAQIQRIREAREAAPEQSLQEVLQGMGYDRNQVAQWMARYGTAEAPRYQAPAEGVIGAEIMAGRYGLQLGMEPGGQFEFLAGAVSMQAPWIQAAQQMGAAPWRTQREQRRIAGQFIQRWTEEGGREEGEAALLMEGAQRYGVLGASAPRFREQATEEAYYQQLAGVAPEMFGLMQQRYNVGAGLRTMGIPWQAPPVGAFQGQPTTANLQLQQQQLMQDQQRYQAFQQLQGGFLGLGMAPGTIDLSQYAGWNMGQINQLQSQQQWATQMGGLLAGRGGMPTRQADLLSQAFTQLPQGTFQQLQGVTSGNPLQFAAYMTQNPEQMAQLPLTMPGIGGTQMTTAYMGMTDIREGTNPWGQYTQTVTGMPWGMSSLAMPGLTSQSMANRIWGADWRGNANINQDLIMEMIEGGKFAGQEWQAQEARKAQQAQAGIQLQQLALSRAFNTGVGIDQYSGIVNPQTGSPFGFNTGKFGFNVPGVANFQSQGGGFWGVQDAFMNMNWAQQQWNFGQQSQQMEMGNRFFQQNMGLNVQQSQMQRGWSMEDWQTQDRTRAMQWGWKVEDFGEQARFLTGRDRRMAERQMGRETIMHDIEGEQIDKQRERQRELWDLEDERFRVQRQQQQEQLRFSQEALKVQMQFFEERKKLEEEQNKLQRAYQIEQMRLSEEQVKASAAYAEIQSEIAETMRMVEEFAVRAGAEGSLFNEDTLIAILEVLVDINPELKELLDTLKEAKKWAGGGGGSGGPRPKPAQYGDTLFSGEMGLVGETSPELIKPYFTSEIIPQGKFDPWQHGVILPTLDDGKKQPIILNISVGGKHLKQVILDTASGDIEI